MTGVFVYGTLMPGRARCAALARWAHEGPLSDRVRGTTVDTGAGYPGLLLDGRRSVPGFVVMLREGAEGAALAVLDDIEGVPAGLYRRVQVTTESGRVCWTYEYMKARASMPVVMGLWRA